MPVAQIAGIMNDSSTRNKGKATKAALKNKEVNQPADKKTKKEKHDQLPKKAKEKKKKAAEKDKPAKEPKAKSRKDAKPVVGGEGMSLIKKTALLPPPSLATNGPPIPLPLKPKSVEDPNFEFIAISYPLNIIEARL